MVGVDDGTKRKIRRQLRRRHSTAKVISQQADQKLESLFIRRFDRLLSVKRFVILWAGLFIVLAGAGVYQARGLSPYYQSLQPVPGGIYTEGIIGTFNNPNPLYATGAADTAASRLVFSGLFKYNKDNQLVGDLAKDYVLSPSQIRYTVHLKHNLKWHDGEPVTADDVVFTYKIIQNISAESSLYSSWQGIKVTKQDPYTINFDLPNALSAFPHSLTNGLIPYHLLKDIPPEQLRSAPFNSSPIGTGPFKWKFIEVTGASQETRQQRISLAAFKDYQGGEPQLDGLNLTIFNDEKQMISAFSQKQIGGMSGLESIPTQLQKDKSLQTYETPLTSAVMVFFNNSNPILKDSTVRRALIESTDRGQLSTLFDDPVRLVDSPLLKGQLGYEPSIVEPAFNLEDANKLLDQAGWNRNSDGQRVKNGQQLTFNMAAQDTPNYTKTAQFVQKQWEALGVKLQINYYGRDELQTSIVGNHDYDALLYGISIGVDPDVFAYWDSSQASITSQGHLNLSEYQSAAADQSIEAGRTREDPTIRAVKYHAFLTQWIKDLPAEPLYQPNYLYISRGPIFNFEHKSANSNTDRFNNVHEWMVRQKKQTNQ